MIKKTETYTFIFRGQEYGPYKTSAQAKKILAGLIADLEYSERVKEIEKLIMAPTDFNGISPSTPYRQETLPFTPWVSPYKDINRPPYYGDPNVWCSVTESPDKQTVAKFGTC